MKPPYRVPQMHEIAAVCGTNGLTVMSTFSGCGGSCLGFEMSGYRVVSALEFVPEARECYALNHPGVPIVGNDIRTVSGKDLLRIAGVDSVDVLEGSPPCAAFSTAGSREKKWGKVSNYSDTQQRSDDLFFEFSRILGEIRPKAFVAENVSGLVKGSAKGYFKMILFELKSKGYKVEARLLDASWLGVPQCRQRVIFIGMREDLNLNPTHPSPLPYRYSLAEVCPWLVPDNNVEHPRTIDPMDCEIIQVGDHVSSKWKTLRVGDSHEKNFSLVRCHPDRPCPTIQASHGQAGIYQTMPPYHPRKFTLLELRRLSGFPDDFKLTGDYRQRWERIGRAVPPVMMAHISAAVAKTLKG